MLLNNCKETAEKLANLTELRHQTLLCLIESLKEWLSSDGVLLDGMYVQDVDWCWGDEGEELLVIEIGVRENNNLGGADYDHLDTLLKKLFGEFLCKSQIKYEITYEFDY